MGFAQVKVSAIAVATLDGLVEANYQRAARLVEIALAERPDVVLLPEAFAAGYCAADLRPYAEAPDSDALRRLRELSRAGDCLLVVGYLAAGPGRPRNAAVLYDRGEVLGVHHKCTLWADAARPYRDEPTLLEPGTAMAVFATRFGPCAVVICYENMVEDNWAEVAPRVDFVLSPYNCEDDPSRHNLARSARHGIPSAWANRTGTVWAGDRYLPNPGTAGICDGHGRVLARSAPGVEAIVTATLCPGTPRGPAAAPESADSRPAAPWQGRGATA